MKIHFFACFHWGVEFKNLHSCDVNLLFTVTATHTHTHTHIYIYIYNMYIYIYVYIYICIYIYIYKYVYTYICICIYYILCVCLCVYVLVTVSKQKTKFWYLKFHALQRSSLITLYKVYRKNYSLITPKKRWCQIGFSRKISSASGYSRHNQIDNSKKQCFWEYCVKTHKKLVLATMS